MNNLLRLVQAASPDEHKHLGEQLEAITLARGDVLIGPDGAIPWVYFPDGAVTSLIRTLANGKQIEVGTTGLEGMAGISAFLDAESTQVQCIAQVPGSAQRLDAATLRRSALPGTILHIVLQRYAQYLYDQAAQSVACNWMHGIEARCARWLLMTHDRVLGDDIELTHEYLATMLGARRAGVSEAASSLQQAGFIRYARGRVTITDRAGLEGASCECYATDRADYDRLLSPDALIRARARATRPA